MGGTVVVLPCPVRVERHFERVRSLLLEPVFLLAPRPEFVPEIVCFRVQAFSFLLRSVLRGLFPLILSVS